MVINLLAYRACSSLVNASVMMLFLQCALKSYPSSASKLSQNLSALLYTQLDSVLLNVTDKFIYWIIMCFRVVYECQNVSSGWTLQCFTFCTSAKANLTDLASGPLMAHKGKSSDCIAYDSTEWNLLWKVHVWVLELHCVLFTQQSTAIFTSICNTSWVIIYYNPVHIFGVLLSWTGYQSAARLWLMRDIVSMLHVLWHET